jgi:hypothetical protein
MKDYDILKLWSGGKHTYEVHRCKSPCPGCGKSGLHRPANKVCLDCFKDLIEIKEMREHMKAEGKDAEALTLPWAPHGLPYIPHEDKPFEKDPENPDIQNAFYSLMDHFGKPLSGTEIESDPMIISKDHSYAKPKLYPKGTQNLARKLFESILRLADTAHAGGFERGEDLLGQLAKGDKTIKDYEEDVKRETGAWKARSGR